MKNSLFIFGTKNFINSLNEVKEYLNFSLMFYDKNTFSESTLPVIYCTIVEEELCNDPDILRLINKEKYKPLLLIKNTKNTKHIIRLPYDDVVTLPLNIKDIIKFKEIQQWAKGR